MLAAVLGLLLSTEAASAQSDGAISVDFDIPAQSLALALDAYSAATGIVAVYNGNLAIGRRSGGIRGRYAPQIALRLLLSNSGLAAQYTTPGAFVLVSAPAESAIVKTPSEIGLIALARQDAAERRYSGQVQSSVTQSLCAAPKTRPGDYRLAMSFWIGPSGEIANLKLLGSTGDQQRDAAIIGMLRRLRLDGGPPHPSMAQPFTMIMLPRSTGGAIDCPASEAGRQDG